MRIRYHFEEKLPNLTTSQCECSSCRLYRQNGISLSFPLISEFAKKGLIILESGPQVRTILTRGNKNNIRLPFPYLYYCISYAKVADKYYYEGIYGCGLRIYASNYKLKSINDSVYLLPIEANRLGLVCTSHDYDGKEYANLSLLINDIVRLWWNTPQNMEYNSDLFRTFEEWSEYSLQAFLNKTSLRNQNLLKNFFSNVAEIYNDNYTLTCMENRKFKKFPENTDFIDEPFFFNKETTLNHDFIDRLKLILIKIKATQVYSKI